MRCRKSKWKPYQGRHEGLQGARLDDEAVAVDVLHDSVEHLPFEGLEDEGREEDVVDHVAGGVLNAPVRDVLLLQTANKSLVSRLPDDLDDVTVGAGASADVGLLNPRTVVKCGHYFFRILVSRFLPSS